LDKGWGSRYGDKLFDLRVRHAPGLRTSDLLLAFIPNPAPRAGATERFADRLDDLGHDFFPALRIRSRRSPRAPSLALLDLFALRDVAIVVTTPEGAASASSNSGCALIDSQSTVPSGLRMPMTTLDCACAVRIAR